MLEQEKLNFGNPESNFGQRNGNFGFLYSKQKCWYINRGFLYENKVVISVTTKDLRHGAKLLLLF